MAQTEPQMAQTEPKMPPSYRFTKKQVGDETEVLKTQFAVGAVTYRWHHRWRHVTDLSNMLLLALGAG